MYRYCGCSRGESWDSHEEHSEGLRLHLSSVHQRDRGKPSPDRCYLPVERIKDRFDPFVWSSHSTGKSKVVLTIQRSYSGWGQADRHQVTIQGF
jgi:hypothetical protein